MERSKKSVQNFPIHQRRFRSAILKFCRLNLTANGSLTRVAGADVEDLVRGLHVLCNDILQARVALVPVELLLVLLVTVLPVFLLTVLGHFFL